MASITIRNLDDSTKKNLRRRAVENGRSLEAEVREILSASVRTPPVKEETGADLFRRIHERFKALGGVDLPLPVRRASKSRIPDFSGSEDE
jgi:plasmid stability protein